MVYRIYVEKKKQFADEAASLLSDIRSLLMIDSLEELRIFNRYDVENISEELFECCEKPFSQSRSLTTPTLACLRPTPRYLQLNICRVSLTRGLTPVLSVFR